MLGIYKKLMTGAEPLLTRLLARRLEIGKEDASRLPERMGIPSRPRPDGALIWIHAASVGEAQSALILIDRLKKETDAEVLLTTGTKTSADLMAKRLPAGCIHQYIPIDHPQWVNQFLNHWRPDLALWMESELWPNLLDGIQTRKIHAVLVNARLSQKSYRHWRLLGGTARGMLSAFSLILAQTDADAKRYRKLGAENILVTDNVKYSAAPLPVDDSALAALQTSRPLWVYASTHAGEESLACRLHTKLKPKVPGLLTIIIPRHPDRRDEVAAEIEKHGLAFTRRGTNRTPPREADDVYLVDTMGELGTFYKLAPIAMIGRSFSLDGGGGHNPIEAGQMGCAVLTGPHVKFQQDIFNDMYRAHACEQVHSEMDLHDTLLSLFHDTAERQKLSQAALRFAAAKAGVIDTVMTSLTPYLKKLGGRDAA